VFDPQNVPVHQLICSYSSGVKIDLMFAADRPMRSTFFVVRSG